MELYLQLLSCKEHLHFRGIYVAAVRLKDGKECIIVKEGLFRGYTKGT